ncbi:hypothetical protein RYZ27_08985 [Hyphomonas sp. FCG-A18]|uniref:hypothetical protein n=1 Tax=Hyphomonas sp. FCG-A18 TaxID=3080019 RepID=UPI002B2CA38C|nr:hypothetical protein RYZ27_08985 [Hyphomonas sp. FCG-A18]
MAMLNLRSLSLLILPAAALDAFATPNCAPDWEHHAELIEGAPVNGSPLSTPLSGGLIVDLSWQKGAISPAIKKPSGDVIPIRKVRRSVTPVRGENPIADHYVFGPDVLDPALSPEFSVSGETAPIATVEPTPGYRGQIWVMPTRQNHTQTKTLSDGGVKACVRWTYFPREADISHYPTPDALVNFPSWVVHAFDDCGLPRSTLLSGRMPRLGYRNRAHLEPDLDGDGLYDLVALINDLETGRSGLAICSQSDRQLELIGLSDASDEEPLSSDFLERLEWWSADGRNITLGSPSAGSKRLYRDSDGTLASGLIGD